MNKGVVYNGIQFEYESENEALDGYCRIFLGSHENGKSYKKYIVEGYFKNGEPDPVHPEHIVYINNNPLTEKCVQYTGKINNNLVPDGFGVASLPNGTIVSGDWENGNIKKDFVAITLQRNYCHVKEGEINLQGNINGEVTMQTAMFNYKGKVTNSLPDGYGVLTCQDQGVVYEGDFSNGLPQGEGKVTINNKNYHCKWEAGEVREGRDKFNAKELESLSTLSKVPVLMSVINSGFDVSNIQNINYQANVEENMEKLANLRSFKDMNRVSCPTTKEVVAAYEKNKNNKVNDLSKTTL